MSSFHPNSADSRARRQGLLTDQSCCFPLLYGHSSNDSVMSATAYPVHRSPSGVIPPRGERLQRRWTAAVRPGTSRGRKAPIPAIRWTVIEPRESTLKRHSRLRQRIVGPAEKRPFVRATRSLVGRGEECRRESSSRAPWRSPPGGYSGGTSTLF